MHSRVLVALAALALVGSLGLAGPAPALAASDTGAGDTLLNVN